MLCTKMDKERDEVSAAIPYDCGTRKVVIGGCLIRSWRRSATAHGWQSLQIP
jgi:hypothetical protein